MKYIIPFFIGFVFTICLYQSDNIVDNSKIVKELVELKNDNTKLEELLSHAFSTDVRDRPMYSKLVTATAYTAREAECDATPWFTASMEPSRVGAVAVRRDLEAIGLTFGKIIIIEGYGAFRIDDRMNARWTNRIDILHANLKAANLFAKRELTIHWLGK